MRGAAARPFSAPTLLHPPLPPSPATPPNRQTTLFRDRAAGLRASAPVIAQGDAEPPNDAYSRSAPASCAPAPAIACGIPNRHNAFSPPGLSPAAPRLSSSPMATPNRPTTPWRALAVGSRSLRNPPGQTVRRRAPSPPAATAVRAFGPRVGRIPRYPDHPAASAASPRPPQNNRRYPTRCTPQLNSFAIIFYTTIYDFTCCRLFDAADKSARRAVFFHEALDSAAMPWQDERLSRNMRNAVLPRRTS